MFGREELRRYEKNGRPSGKSDGFTSYVNIFYFQRRVSKRNQAEIIK